jgi:hypothetical protein
MADKKKNTPKDYDRWNKVGFKVVSKPKKKVKKSK